MDEVAAKQPLAALTGGSGSLGQAIQAQLAAQGWRWLAPSRQELDVCSPPAADAWFGQLPEAPELYIHAAGAAEDALLARLTEDAWDRMLFVNLRSALFCARAAAAAMLPRGRGHILLIGSAAARLGGAGQCSYAAAKAGLTGLTASLAREWGPHGLRVNCVWPGWLEPSRMTAAVSPAARSAALQAHILPQFSAPADAARFLLFLHSMPAVSGQVFQLDSRIG